MKRVVGCLLVGSVCVCERERLMDVFAMMRVKNGVSFLSWILLYANLMVLLCVFWNCVEGVWVR